MKTGAPDSTPVSQLKLKTGISGGMALGDAVSDITHATGIEKLVRTYTRVTGQDCGCERRRQTLNAKVPEIFPWRRIA